MEDLSEEQWDEICERHNLFQPDSGKVDVWEECKMSLMDDFITKKQKEDPRLKSYHWRTWRCRQRMFTSGL